MVQASWNAMALTLKVFARTCRRMSSHWSSGASAASQQPVAGADQRRATWAALSVGRSAAGLRSAEAPPQPQLAPARASRRRATRVAVGGAQVLSAERAEGVLAVAGGEVVEADAPGALRRELPHDVGERHASVAGGTRVGIPAEEGERLEMDAAHGGQTVEGEVEDAPELVEVDPAHDGGHEHDAQAGLRAALHGALLQGGQRAPAKGEMGGVVDAVELQEDGLQAGGGERLGVAVVCREPQPVGVELQEGEPERASESDDPRQVVAHRRLAAGELDVAAGSLLEQAPVPPLDLVDRGVRRRPRRAPAKQIGHSRSQRAVTSSSTQQVCRA